MAYHKHLKNIHHHLKNSHSKKVKAASAVTKLVILFIILGISIFFFSLIQYPKQPYETVNNQLGQYNKITCKQYGLFSTEGYLLPYTTKAGETPASIVKSQLKTKGRVNELLNLNKDRYPDLTANSIIPVGTQVFLPPKYIKKSSGKLKTISGQITGKFPQGWVILYDPQNNKRMNIHSNKTTKVLDAHTPQVGECVTMVFDAKASAGRSALGIEKQK